MAHELHEYLPKGWKVTPTNRGLCILSTDMESALDFAKGAKAHLQRTASNIRGLLEIRWDGCINPIRVTAQTEAVVSNTGTQPTKPSRISSYAPIRVSPNATPDEVNDFIRGKKAEGLVVTITSMVSDKCLSVNDLQVLDRGGGWTGDDWIGLDFKKLWRDSFRLGRTNYYGQLIETVERDKSIPEFYYHIRRPSGALAEYSSSYHFVEEFLGIPARIAVSVPGDWAIIESAPNGSE
jgi:hypothetical protein